MAGRLRAFMGLSEQKTSKSKPEVSNNTINSSQPKESQSNNKFPQKESPGNTNLQEKESPCNTKLQQKESSGNTNPQQKSSPSSTSSQQKVSPSNSRSLVVKPDTLQVPCGDSAGESGDESITPTSRSELEVFSDPPATSSSSESSLTLITEQHWH